MAARSGLNARLPFTLRRPMPEPTTPASTTTIESVLQEQRLFPPPAELAAHVAIGSLDAYRALCERALADPDGF